MWLYSQRHILGPHQSFYIRNCNFYRTDRFPGRKGGTAVAVRKSIPHNHVDLPPLVSVEACIPTGKSKLRLADVYKPPRRSWINADIIELLNVRHKSVLTVDLNANHPFWNSAVSNLSGENCWSCLILMNLKSQGHNAPLIFLLWGMVMCLILWHQNVRLSEVIASDVLDSDHLPIIFHILDHVTTNNLSDPIEKFADLERFQNLASDLVPPRIQINSVAEVDKAACDFTASIASAYRLATGKVTLSDLNSDIPGLDTAWHFNVWGLRTTWT
jgi:hypothetical protein